MADASNQFQFIKKYWPSALGLLSCAGVAHQWWQSGGLLRLAFRDNLLTGLLDVWFKDGSLRVTGEVKFNDWPSPAA